MNKEDRRVLRTADRLRKLRAMSTGEFWTRIRYGTYCRLERRWHARGALNRPDRLQHNLTRGLAGSTNWRSALLQGRRNRRARFFAGVEQSDAIRAYFLADYAQEHAHARVQADRILNQEFFFFGEAFRYSGAVDWHADPVSRSRWPTLYHRDVFVDAGDVGFGDVKYVWELSRHQFVVDLAKAWAIDRTGLYASAVRALVFDWRAATPPATGVPWACALEPAFRVLSWLWAYFLTLDDPEFDDDSHIQWLEGFLDHGWFLYRHLEYYSSPFNHLIGEACALYCLGVLFPEFKESSKWRTHGRHVLESRLPEQFYRDGGSVEQSTFYHHATTGFYLLAALLGRINGEEFSGPVWRSIEKAIEFSMVMQQPDGSTPRIGGADDGKPIRLEHRPLWDFRPYQALGAVLFGRSDFKATAGRFWEDALWLLGTDGAASFHQLSAVPPAPPSRALTSSGYVVIRNRWTSDADYLCFDCGEQAAGLRRDDVPSAAHGHADCLSVIIWRRGRPVLVDAGFYCYNGPKLWQDHFRETAAHNTVRIDGRDQARHINKMAWSHTYTASLEGVGLDGSGWVIGSHDGYRALAHGGVTHRRAVWVRERGYIVIWDSLDGTGRHDVEWTFQFAPGTLQLCAERVTFDDWACLQWFAATDVVPRIRDGEAAPDGGWIAPSLGIKRAAPRLVLTAAMTLPFTFVTIITDIDDGRPEVTQCSPGEPYDFRVSGRGWTDYLTVSGFGEASRRLQTDGIMAAWTFDDGRFIPDGRIDRPFGSARTGIPAE